MKKPLFIVAGCFIVLVLLMNMLVEEPVFDRLADQLTYELKTNHPEKAEIIYFKILQQDSLNIEHHYNYIQNHFRIPFNYKKNLNTYENRNDNTIFNFYQRLSYSVNPHMADIGQYGKGLIYSHSASYSDAIREYMLVKDSTLSHIHNSIGFAYLHSGLSDKAEYHFRREIALGGNVKGAWINLIYLLHDLKKDEELKALLKEASVVSYFPYNLKRILYFKSFLVFQYYSQILRKIHDNLNIYGFLAAFLIMMSWVIYLRKLDIYESETWKHVGFTLFFGMLFSLLTYPLSDINQVLFGFSLNGEVLNDFLYCVLGIGAMEELVKIVPLLIMLRYTKAINEPYDYILYASLSALGFAFVENLIYFDETNLQIIHGRALTAVVSHMFDSSIIAYGLMLNKYKRRINPVLNFIIYLGLASLAHGFYDFWLINKQVNSFSIITIIFLLTTMYMWNSFHNNALNHSVFFDKEKCLDNGKLQQYLIYSLTGLGMFEYIVITLKYSPSVANEELFASMYSGSFLILFLSGTLSTFFLRQGKWGSIRIWGVSRIDKLESLLDSAVDIKAFSINGFTVEILPNHGVVVNRLSVSGEPDWYLVRLNQPHQMEFFLKDYMLVRAKIRKQPLEKGKERLAACFLIPEVTNMEKKHFQKMDFRFCGWVKATIK